MEKKASSWLPARPLDHAYTTCPRKKRQQDKGLLLGGWHSKKKILFRCRSGESSPLIRRKMHALLWLIPSARSGLAMIDRDDPLGPSELITRSWPASVQCSQRLLSGRRPAKRSTVRTRHGLGPSRVLPAAAAAAALSTPILQPRRQFLDVNGSNEVQ